jgi:hypothetical protein
MTTGHVFFGLVVSLVIVAAELFPVLKRGSIDPYRLVRQGKQELVQLSSQRNQLVRPIESAQRRLDLLRQHRAKAESAIERFPVAAIVRFFAGPRQRPQPMKRTVGRQRSETGLLAHSL